MMVKSMTGYGRSEQVFENRSITVEIKAVNHRYFEFSCHIPRMYSFLEERLKSLLQTSITRGKVDIYISMEDTSETPSEVTLNRSLAQGYLNALRELAQLCGLPQESVDLQTLARNNDIFTVRKEPDDEEHLWAQVEQVSQTALRMLIQMRGIEGARLQEDIEQRLGRIEEMTASIEQRAPELVQEYRERLEIRIREILEDRQIDEQRLLTETAVFADKIAVAEETVRLRSHLAQFRDMMNHEEVIGRKLDFLVQEMNREVNTIGSKIQNVDVTSMVIEIKSEIEKIREQIQNIE